MSIYILTTTHFKCPYIKDTFKFYTCVYMYIVLYCICSYVYIVLHVCIILYSMFIYVCIVLYVLYILYLWQVCMYPFIMHMQPLKLMDVICSMILTLPHVHSRQQLTTLVLKSRSCGILQNMVSLLEGPLLYL